MVHHTDQNPARAENCLKEDHLSLTLSRLSGSLGFVLAFSGSSSHTSSFPSICLSCDSHYAWRVLTCLLSSPWHQVRSHLPHRGLHLPVRHYLTPHLSTPGPSPSWITPWSSQLSSPPLFDPSTTLPPAPLPIHQLHSHSPSPLCGKFVASTGQNPIPHKNKCSTLLCPAAGLGGLEGGITKHAGQTESPRMPWAPRLTTPCPLPAWCPQRSSGTRDRSQMGWIGSETASPWTVN